MGFHGDFMGFHGMLTHQLFFDSGTVTLSRDFMGFNWRFFWIILW